MIHYHRTSCLDTRIQAEPQQDRVLFHPFPVTRLEKLTQNLSSIYSHTFRELFSK